MRFIDLTGKKFGKLIVVKKHGKRNGYLYWECVCDCGNVKIVAAANLGRSQKSCGCLRRLVNAGMQTTHGGRFTRLYQTWKGMRQRTLNKKSTRYPNYGGRGISICKEWDDFCVFRKWAHENGYNENLEIDRINNDGNYEPFNCRWVTHAEQQRNTTRSILYNGETASEASRRLGGCEKLVATRVTNYGWSLERAFNEPIQ